MSGNLQQVDARWNQYRIFVLKLVDEWTPTPSTLDIRVPSFAGFVKDMHAGLASEPHHQTPTPNTSSPNNQHPNLREATAQDFLTKLLERTSNGAATLSSPVKVPTPTINGTNSAAQSLSTFLGAAPSTPGKQGAMEYTRNGAGRDQGSSLVLDIKMNELPPLSQVSPRASKQGETQKRSVPIGKPSANQTSPTVNGATLEAHLLSMIRGPTPDKQGVTQQRLAPIGIPSANHTTYPAPAWAKNLCWLDSSLEILYVCYLKNIKLWRKLGEVSAGDDIHNPAHIWHLLVEHMHKRSMLYETCAKDLEARLTASRDAFAEAIAKAKLTAGPVGTLDTPWGWFFTLLGASCNFTPAAQLFGYSLAEVRLCGQPVALHAQLASYIKCGFDLPYAGPDLGAWASQERWKSTAIVCWHKQCTSQSPASLTERPLSVPIVMIFRQEDGHQGDYEIPARFAFGDARVTYELVGRIEYEAEFEHFTSHFRHSSSNTLFHYDDLQKMVLVDPSKTIEDLCGRVSMQCSPSKAINSYVYHLINAETLQGSFFDLACQHLRTSFHTQVGPRTITGEYELGVHLEGWRQIDSAKLRSRYRTWDFALMNHGDEGSSKPAISTAPNSQAMDHTRNGAGRDQGLSLVLDIKMNELPPLSQVSPRASRQGETQKRSVPIGKPSANQTSPTVDGTSLEAHLLSMIRGPAPSTPDKQGAMDHTRNGAGCDRGLSPALDIKMNEPSPLLQVSPRVSRPLQPDRKKVLILNCRCGRKGDYIPASDFGTFQCTNCSKCTHIACMPKGGGYLTLGHHLFHRRAARGFECHDCDPPGLDSLRLKDRVPSIISRKNKMATQPGIAFLAKHGNYHYPVILLSAMDPADVESDYWVSWWRGNRYCTSPAPLPVSLVPFKSLQDLCIGNHVRRRKVRFGCWEFASKFRITDSDIVIDQDTAHFTGYNSQATEEVDRILSPHHSALEEMMKQGPNHEHTAECTSVLCRRQVDLLKTTSKKALRSDFNTAWAVTTSGFIHHTTLTEADVGAITVWMMQKSFDSFDNNHCSAEDHRRRLRWSLSPGTAHAWALVVASRRKEGWEEKEGRSLAQKELEDRAFDELISVEPKGDHSPTVDTHREAMEVLEYLLFHQNPAWKQGCLNVWGFNSGPHQDDWDPQETYKQSYDPDPMPSDVEEAIVEAAVSRVNSFFERTYSSGT